MSVPQEDAMQKAPTLAERAIGAFQGEQREAEARRAAEDANRDAVMRKRFAGEIQARLKVDVAPEALEMDPTEEEWACMFVVDDLRLRGLWDWGGFCFRTVQTCPECGKEVASVLMRSLTDLGRVLSTPLSDWHHCAPEPGSDPEPAPMPTTEQRLLKALRDYIAEAMPS